MTDELATAVFVLVTAFISIAAGFAWWANRPKRTRHESVPRIQPLFPGEAVGAVAGGVDELDESRQPLHADGIAHAPGNSREVPRGFGPVGDTPAAPDSPSAQSAHAAPELSHRTRSAAPVEPPLPSWESAAARAQRASGPQMPLGDRSGPGGRDLSRGVGTAWAGGGLRNESAQAMPRRVPMQSHMERAVDRHGERPAERHVERYADRQPERFTQGMGGGRQAQVGEWATGGNPSSMRPPVGADGWHDGQSVRFSVPTDGTLQFLPGRLEITAGHEAGREIRFVRVPNSEPEITFGRTEGTPYRHVQLRDGTVSRLHARMRLHEGRWTLTNLSTTNPVTYNGRVLGDGEEQPLEQDDRIEMGEVAFRFRTR